MKTTPVIVPIAILPRPTFSSRDASDEIIGLTALLTVAASMATLGGWMVAGPVGAVVLGFVVGIVGICALSHRARCERHQ